MYIGYFVIGFVLASVYLYSDYFAALYGKQVI